MQDDSPSRDTFPHGGAARPSSDDAPRGTCFPDGMAVSLTPAAGPQAMTAAPALAIGAPRRPVPPIHSICPIPQRLTWQGRATAALVAAGCLALLVTALMLQPDPSGVGSHRKLGLAPCSLMQSANLPCPSCGMTTSFTWFVRGNILASLYVQPMGTVLAFAAAATFWGGLYATVSGKPLHRLLRPIPSRYYVLVPVGLTLAAWAWKVFIHLRGIGGWG